MATAALHPHPIEGDSLDGIFARAFGLGFVADSEETVSGGLGAYARSGLIGLCGACQGPPRLPARDYFGRIASLCGLARRLARASGHDLQLDPRLLVERAALLGLRRRGRMSANRSCRMVPTGEGWLALNLARDEDRALMPALLGGEIAGDPWQALATFARRASAAEIVAFGRMLGLPVAAVGEGCEAPPIMVTRLGAASRAAAGQPLVIDMSALWAGPLCARLLTATGARVIKVESIGRPDGARHWPAFYDLLHAGQESVALDFSSREDIAKLKALLARADIIIEASRPRALRRLGIHVEEVFRANPSVTWVGITAHGRTPPFADWVGFGDDAAAAAGLAGQDDRGEPIFFGDAIADPLAGLMAFAGVAASRLTGGGHLLDISLRSAAAYVANAPIWSIRPVVERDGKGWRVRARDHCHPVLSPRVPVPVGHAPALGADSERVLAELV